MSTQIPDKPSSDQRTVLANGGDVGRSWARLRWNPRKSDIPALSVLVGFVGVALSILALVIAMVGSYGVVPRGGGVTATAAASGKPGNATVPAHQTYDAALSPAPTGNVVDVNLVTKAVTVSIAPNVAYQAWTFNGTVPGPVIHVRQGQTVHFTLTNSAGMPHSIDFHAAQVPWNLDYQAVAPGKTLTFDFVANYPGVFMYHCGTPPVIYHIANGMYGAIIVDPAGGYQPAAEYVVVQSEFYTHQNPDGTYAIDGTKLMSDQPDYVVFNGYANQYKDAPLTAKAGQRIRIFIVDAGPTNFAAFHVIGAVFSDAYADGNPANRTVGDQTVAIPPGGASMVELTIPDAGTYPFVTHAFRDASEGALGLIKVTP